MIDAIEPIDGHVTSTCALLPLTTLPRRHDDLRDAIARRRIVICTYEVAGHDGGRRPHRHRSNCGHMRWWFCQRAWYSSPPRRARRVRRLKLNRFTLSALPDRPFRHP